MPLANRYHLHYLLAPLNTLTDEEGYTVSSANDEEDFRAVIVRFIKPYVQCWAEESRSAAKASLQYYLNSPDFQFDEVLAEQQESPLPYPEDDRLFFIWIWTELFGAEDFALPSLDGWTEINDPSKAVIKRH